MKVFRIKDEDGAEYKVEEVEEQDACETKDEVTPLSEEEITALRKLLPHIDKLVTLTEVKTEDTTDLPEDKLNDEDDLDEEDLDAEKEEEVVDTDKIHDSKKSVGSLEKRKVVANDSVDVQDDINTAWTKRYSMRRED